MAIISRLFISRSELAMPTVIEQNLDSNDSSVLPPAMLYCMQFIADLLGESGGEKTGGGGLRIPKSKDVCEYKTF